MTMPKRLRLAVLLSLTIAGPHLVAAMPVEHVAGRHVDVGGVRLWIEEEGSGEPLVLIAGGPGLSHAYFHPWFSRLRDQFRVIYVDAFGTGKSSRAAQPLEYSLADDVEHLEALRTTLNLGSINILGHSYGGMVAMAYAAAYPQGMRRLIVANAVPSGDDLQMIQDNWNDQFRKQMPEAWSKVRDLRARGIRSSAPGAG